MKIRRTAWWWGIRGENVCNFTNFTTDSGGKTKKSLWSSEDRKKMITNKKHNTQWMHLTRAVSTQPLTRQLCQREKFWLVT